MANPQWICVSRTRSLPETHRGAQVSRDPAVAWGVQITPRIRGCQTWEVTPKLLETITSLFHKWARNRISKAAKGVTNLCLNNNSLSRANRLSMAIKILPRPSVVNPGLTTRSITTATRNLSSTSAKNTTRSKGQATTPETGGANSHLRKEISPKRPMTMRTVASN